VSNQDSAHRQGQSDANQNRGPADTTNWNSNLRDSYNAAYQRQKEEDAKKSQ
jgi:hypothetical protein